MPLVVNEEKSWKGRRKVRRIYTAEALHDILIKKLDRKLTMAGTSYKKIRGTTLKKIEARDIFTTHTPLLLSLLQLYPLSKDAISLYTSENGLLDRMCSAGKDSSGECLINASQLCYTFLSVVINVSRGENALAQADFEGFLAKLPEHTKRYKKHKVDQAFINIWGEGSDYSVVLLQGVERLKTIVREAYPEVRMPIDQKRAREPDAEGTDDDESAVKCPRTDKTSVSTTTTTTPVNPPILENPFLAYAQMLQQQMRHQAQRSFFTGAVQNALGFWRPVPADELPQQPEAKEETQMNRVPRDTKI